MPSRVSVLAIDALDPRRVAGFWAAVLDWEVVDESHSGLTIAPREPANDAVVPSIDVLPVPERKTVKNRLHLDLRADGVTTEVELARLLELGARPVDVGQPEDASWVVLADPEGNEFCLLSRTVQDVAAESGG